MPLVARCACAVMGRNTHHPMCLWRPASVATPEEEPNEVAPPPAVPEREESPPPVDPEEDQTMARRAAAKTVEPATAREAREYLLENQDSLPEGVTVGARGRLSQAAKDHFTKVTKRPIAEPAA